MRRAIAILALFMLAAFPAEASEGRHAEWVTDPVLPDVQWNASVDIGYISTAPLVKEGLVIVKGGGDPMTGEGAGLVAYRADTGVEIWRSIHTASDRGFEIAPLIHILGHSQSSNTCAAERDMVVTGWTSGHLTAYDFVTGEELWNQSTAAPNWGITGGGFSLSIGEIIWPTETGVVQVCAANGTILHQHHDSAIRTYRANLGIWMNMETDVNNTITTSMGWLQGTESGHLLRYDDNSSLIEDIDITELANLSGTWRLRSTPIFLIEYGVMMHLHSDGTSNLVRMGWNESGNATLFDSIPLGPGTATTSPGLNLLTVFAGSESAIHFGVANGSIFETMRWNATDVAGEIQWIQWGEVTAICLPQNTAEGSWYIAIDENHSVEWIPEQTGYVTAGCGSDGLVHAVANDASWLEVRYDPLDWNSIHTSSDSTLGTSEEPDTTEPPEVEDENISAETGIPGLIWLPFIGAGIFAIVAQFAVSSDIRRQVRIGALLMVMLGLVMAAAIYNAQIVSEPESDSSQRTRASLLVPALDEGLAENEVLVAFHFPESYAPDGCTGGEVFSLETNQYWSIDSAPEGSDCIVVAAIEIESGDTVEMVTMTTLANYQYTYEIEHQILGPFLQDIGDATGGSDGRWWSYDLNGGYGTTGMVDQAIQPGDHIDWHFDEGQF
jgi:hypothetical protein